MGWGFKWVSSGETSFNFDYGVSFTSEEMTNKKALFNYRMQFPGRSEREGHSVFYKNASSVLHTYSCYDRGNEMLANHYHYLDIVRREAHHRPARSTRASRHARHGAHTARTTWNRRCRRESCLYRTAARHAARLGHDARDGVTTLASSADDRRRRTPRQRQDEYLCSATRANESLARAEARRLL